MWFSQVGHYSLNTQPLVYKLHSYIDLSVTPHQIMYQYTRNDGIHNVVDIPHMMMSVVISLHQYNNIQPIVI